MHRRRAGCRRSVAGRRGRRRRRSDATPMRRPRPRDGVALSPFSAWAGARVAAARAGSQPPTMRCDDTERAVDGDAERIDAQRRRDARRSSRRRGRHRTAAARPRPGRRRCASPSTLPTRPSSADSPSTSVIRWREESPSTPSRASCCCRFGHRERQDREDEEGAGEHRHQREHRQVDPVGARHVARRARRLRPAPRRARRRAAPAAMRARRGRRPGARRTSMRLRRPSGRAGPARRRCPSPRAAVRRRRPCRRCAAPAVRSGSALRAAPMRAAARWTATTPWPAPTACPASGGPPGPAPAALRRRVEEDGSRVDHGEAARTGVGSRQHRRRQRADDERIDAEHAQGHARAVAVECERVAFDHRAGQRHRPVGRHLRVERFVEPGARAHEREVGVAVHGAHRGAELGERRGVDQVHRIGEGDAEHDGDERRHVAPGVVAKLRPGKPAQQAQHGTMPSGVRVRHRSARAAAASECVDQHQAAPCSRVCATSTSITRAAVAGSRLPVGSSASSSAAGAPARARSPRAAAGRRSAAAAAARPGRQADRVQHGAATRASSGCAQQHQRQRRRSAPRPGAAARGRPGTRSRRGGGAAARAVVVERRRGRCRRARRGRRPSCRGPAMQLSSVDLPTPDSPTMATNSPARDLAARRRANTVRRRSAWPGRRTRSVMRRALSRERQHLRRCASGASQATTCRCGMRAQPGQLALGELARGGDAACRAARASGSARRPALPRPAGSRRSA